MTLEVGCDWPAASLLARPALLWSRLLLLAWCSAPDHPVDIAQEVQDQRPEISEFSPAFHRDDWDTTRNTDQLCALGYHLLLVQLRHPSPLLRLVVQVQLCVYLFSIDTLCLPRIPNAPGMIDILSAALDASYSISMVFIFFTLQYPENGRIGLNTIQTWWGNTVYTKTADFQGIPFKTLAEGQTFGPTSW
jgi:hypothetical protein